MVQDSGDFSKQGSDVLGTLRDFNIEEFLDSQGEALFIGHHRDVVQPVEVGESLQVGLVLDQFLGAAVEQADVGVGPDDFFAIEFEDESEHAVGSRMLGAEVDSVVADLAVLDRVLARLLHGTGELGVGAVRVAGVGKVLIHGDESGAHWLGSGIFSKTCR